MIEIFSYAFFQNALIASFLASIACGIIGSIIVVKRMSLITGSISHSAFGGLGLSYFLGFPALLGAVFFSLISASFIALIRKKALNKMDVLLSALWAIGMSLGLIFIFLTPGYSGDLFTYLFGNILLINSFDLILVFILDLIIVLVSIVFFNSFLTVIFDEEYAETKNMPVTLIYLILFSLIALTIVLLIKIVGIVLLIALLSLPAATAQLFTKTLKKMMIFASIITLISALSGVMLAFLFNFPPGPIIVLITAIFYLAGIAIKSVK
ncbi:MAG: metal ABC transporter permease [Candidatus Diapherotrites archaeon]|nr:metal ABC transporter permease [Candidatus Diapherotrites archaeon]